MPAPIGNQNAIRNYVGMRYGWLTVIAHEGWVESGPQRRPILRLRCECGKEVVRRRDTLVKTSSCGCKHGETIKGNTNHRGSVDSEQAATEHPRLLDIAWAAGVWEGEGSVTGNWFVRADGKRIRMIQVTVTQKDPWLLERFRALFGGRIRADHQKGEGVINGRVLPREGVIYHWCATGSRARGFFMTIWPFLSPRRHEQILKGGFSFRDEIKSAPA